MKITMKLLMFLFFTCFSGSMGYKILVYFAAPSRSHNILGRGIVRALLDQGHEVSWVTPYPDKAKKETNLKLIDVSVTREILEYDEIKTRGASSSVVFGRNITKFALGVESLKQALIKEQYDGVVTECLFDDVPAGIAAVQNVPWVLVSPVPMLSKTLYNVDDPITMVTVPTFFLLEHPPLNFVGRVKNAFKNLQYFYNDWSNRDENLRDYKKFFEPIAAARNISLKPFSSACLDVSMILVNSHPALYPVTSVPPNVIDIGGYHIDDEYPPLPEDLKHIMDNSQNGVIYFSMGTVLDESVFSEKTRDEIIQILGALNETVLWKFDRMIEGLPKNILIRKWMPQNSILAHPNVKVFITHGGFLSTLESIKYGVPQILIPIFADQPSNALRAEYYGFGLRVKHGDSLAQELEVKLKEILHNDSYSEKAKYLSSVFRKRPVPPRKLIAHYVEMAIETKGAPHLKPISHQYAWYQRYMLDIIAFLLLILLAVVKFIYKTVKILFTIKIRKVSNFVKKIN